MVEGRTSLKSLTVPGLSPRPLPRLLQACKSALASDSFSDVRDWWLEILALLAPLVLLNVLVRVPSIPATLNSELSIGTVATVQGTVTGLSLIALVLAVELARRQEDRDDTVYDLMLRAAWIRPSFTFAIAALLATLVSVSISHFSVDAAGSHSVNILLGAYILTGGVGIVLLATVIRTVLVLRPTGIVDFRFRANDQERQLKVLEFLSRATDEYPNLDPVERVLLPHRPLGLTATERLFVEIDDALESQHAARFSGALQRMRLLVLNSADQIAESELGFQPPGQPQFGYWFPLDAVQGRLSELWRAAFERQGIDFTREMWSFEYWLVMTGIERRSGELLEIGLRSGLIGYQASKEAGRSYGHAGHEWLNLRGAAWWKLRPYDAELYDHEKEVFVPRLIEYFQEYGNMLLVAGDSDSFRDMLTRFSDTFFDREKRAWLRVFYTEKQTGQLTNFEYSVMALLALAGRAMTMSHKGKLANVNEYLDPIQELIENFAPIERFVPAAYEPERPLHQQWEWWEINSEERDDSSFKWTASQQYVMLTLLLKLLKSDSDQPLASLGGYAQRLIDTWATHKDLLMELAGVDSQKRGETDVRLTGLLATAKAAEETEKEEFYMDASQDPIRVGKYLAKLRDLRRKDRIIERYFGETGRVRYFTEEEWGDKPRLGYRVLVPREPFVHGVIHSTYVEELDAEPMAHGFEGPLIAKLAEEVERTAEMRHVDSDDLDALLYEIDSALADIGEGRTLIVFVGDWPHELYMEIAHRKWSDEYPELTVTPWQHRLILGGYRGGMVLWLRSENEQTVVALNVEEWGWIDRATINGDDVEATLAEIERSEAERRANAELLGEATPEAISRRVRELRTKVVSQASERVSFEVEKPAAARMIRVVSSDADAAQREA